MTPFISNGVVTARNRVIPIDFVAEYEIESTWENHTDKARIKFPKNVILKTETYMFQESGTYNVILGGTGAVRDGRNKDTEGNPIVYPPLIMRGDIVTIQDGYWFINENGENIQVGETRFSGFISRVESGTPICIDCEDNFYLLKRVPLDVSVWGKEIVSLCNHMISLVNSNFHDKDDRYPKLSFFDNTDSLTANFSLGHLDIGDVTCSELLSRLRSQYHLESFFVGNVLKFGFPIYDENTANSNNFFGFENNIINSELSYTNKGDVVLSAIVNAVNISKTGKKTRDGNDGTKRVKKSILVYWDLVTETFKYHSKVKSEPFPKNEGGERRTFIYAIDPNDPAPTDQQLFDYGKAQLEKYYYTGFKGSFTTFGFPFVKWNDNVNLVSRIFSDRNGVYKVKKVTYRGGFRGLRQEVCLDYKLNVPVPTSVKQIIMR